MPYTPDSLEDLRKASSLFPRETIAPPDPIISDPMDLDDIEAIHNLEIEQIDFIGAFLNGILKEPIFLELLEGSQEGTSQILQLQKALYGLKQSPREWQQALISLGQKLGFEPLASDSATLYNKRKGIFVITHINDCLIVGPDLAEINKLKKAMHKTYAIEDRGPAALFLGVQIIRDRKKGIIKLAQKHYIEEAIEFFGLTNQRPAYIPLQPNLSANPSISNQSDKLDKANTKLFQAIIGTAIYLAIQTRPDIAFAIHFLTGSFQSPYKEQLSAAFKLFSYLSQSKGLAISYNSLGNQDPIGYCDSDFAGDKISAKSTYGYIIQLAGGPISWKAKRASTIALSTLEAEYNAITEATKEIQWIVGLFLEVKKPLKLPIALYNDNQ